MRILGNQNAKQKLAKDLIFKLIKTTNPYKLASSQETLQINNLIKRQKEQNQKQAENQAKTQRQLSSIEQKDEDSFFSAKRSKGYLKNRSGYSLDQNVINVTVSNGKLLKGKNKSEGKNKNGFFKETSIAPNSSAHQNLYRKVKSKRIDQTKQSKLQLSESNEENFHLKIYDTEPIRRRLLNRTYRHQSEPKPVNKSSHRKEVNNEEEINRNFKFKPTNSNNKLEDLRTNTSQVTNFSYLTNRQSSFFTIQTPQRKNTKAYEDMKMGKGKNQQKMFFKVFKQRQKLEEGIFECLIQRKIANLDKTNTIAYLTG